MSDGDEVARVITRNLAGLVDQVVYADQFKESLAEKLKTAEIELVTDYKKKKADTDFSGFSGMMKMMELLMGGKPSKTSSKQKKILREFREASSKANYPLAEQLDKRKEAFYERKKNIAE